MIETNITLRVDQKLAGPTFVVEGLPDIVGVVQYDRVIDFEVSTGLFNLSPFASKLEFWCMHTDRDQATIFVLAGPLHYIRQGAHAVDTGVIPKIHQHNFAAQSAQRQRVAVDPTQVRRELGCVDRLCFEHERILRRRQER